MGERLKKEKEALYKNKTETEYNMNLQREQIEKENAKLATKQERLNERELQIKAKVGKYKMECENYSDLVKKNKEKLQILCAEYKSKAEKLKDAKLQISDVKNAKQSLDNELYQLKASKERCLEKLCDLKTEIEKCKLNKQNLENNVQSLKLKLAEMQQKILEKNEKNENKFNEIFEELKKEKEALYKNKTETEYNMNLQREQIKKESAKLEAKQQRLNERELQIKAKV